MLPLLCHTKILHSDVCTWSLESRVRCEMMGFSSSQSSSSGCTLLHHDVIITDKIEFRIHVKSSSVWMLKNPIKLVCSLYVAIFSLKITTKLCLKGLTHHWPVIQKSVVQKVFTWFGWFEGLWIFCFVWTVDTSESPVSPFTTPFSESAPAVWHSWRMELSPSNCSYLVIKGLWGKGDQRKWGI